LAVALTKLDRLNHFIDSIIFPGRGVGNVGYTDGLALAGGQGGGGEKNLSKNVENVP
jgi:hypothetical protein